MTIISLLKRRVVLVFDFLWAYIMRILLRRYRINLECCLLLRKHLSQSINSDHIFVRRCLCINLGSQNTSSHGLWSSGTNINRYLTRFFNFHLDPAGPRGDRYIGACPGLFSLCEVE